MVTLFEYLSREDADTFSLVLNAVGIGHRVVGTEYGFCIDVPEPFAEAALTAIQRYQSENPAPRKTTAIPPRKAVTYPLSGVFVALGLLAVYLAIAGSQAPQDYARVFGADARHILNGEFYRCATALVLHADATHIAGNMAGIAIFGGAVCAVTGTGTGWLMILACGVCGNFLNAWAYQRDHLSVGASTAIFGALGVLCAIQVIGALRTGSGWKQAALIIGAGIALLAFLGSGERSDIGAHLFGWLSGVLLGGVHAMALNHPPGRQWQAICGTAAALTLLAAWMRGVAG